MQKDVEHLTRLAKGKEARLGLHVVCSDIWANCNYMKDIIVLERVPGPLALKSVFYIIRSSTQRCDLILLQPGQADVHHAQNIAFKILLLYRLLIYIINHGPEERGNDRIGRGLNIWINMA